MNMKESKALPKTEGVITSLPVSCSSTPEIYVFGRAGGFYVLELKDDAEAKANAECNPGTQNVSTIGGRPVWLNDKIQP